MPMYLMNSSVKNQRLLLYWPQAYQTLLSPNQQLHLFLQQQPLQTYTPKFYHCYNPTLRDYIAHHQQWYHLYKLQLLLQLLPVSTKLLLHSDPYTIAGFHNNTHTDCNSTNYPVPAHKGPDLKTYPAKDRIHDHSYLSAQNHPNVHAEYTLCQQ